MHARIRILRGGMVARIRAALVIVCITAGPIAISACSVSGGQRKGEGDALAIGAKLKITKLVNRSWIPLGDTANDLTPFIVMAGLLTAAAILMWTLPKRKWARRVVQTVSAAAFIVGIHPCGCMTRDLILGAADLSVNDLSAFKYMIVFTTVGVFAAVVGRNFCGWLCPLGYAQELIAKFSRRFWGAVADGRYLAALWRVVVFFIVVGIIYAALIAAPGRMLMMVLGGCILVAAGIVILGTRLRTVALVKYLFGVCILGAIVYAFYRSKPGTYSIIEYAMVFFVMGLTLIVLTVIGNEGNDRFFKRFRYALWLGITGVYVYNLFNVGPMCLFFQGSTEWPVLLSFGGVFLLSILVSMSWCRYMCPEGAALGLLAAKAGWQINRTDACTGCKTCEKACPLQCIECGVRDRRTCIYCCKCMDACPQNALVLVNEIGGDVQAVPYPPPECVAEEKPCAPVQQS